jgi:hypothetical protein
VRTRTPAADAAVLVDPAETCGCGAVDAVSF